jgi:hypothetical protein
MKLAQHLEKLDSKLLGSIATKLRIKSIDIPTRSFLVFSINNYLNDFSKTYWIYERIGTESRIALLQVLYTGKTIYEKWLREIEEYGVIYDGVIPEDLKSILQENLKKLVVRQLPDYRHKVLDSYFAMTLRILKMFMSEQKIKLDISNGKNLKKLIDKINIPNLDVVLLKKVLEHFIALDLMSYQNKILIPNVIAITQWFESYPNNFLQFYHSIIQHTSPGIFELLKALGEIQQDIYDWMEADIFSALGRNNLTIEKCERTGLVETVQISGQYLIQLTNEGWFLTKGVAPISWSNRNLLVSAAFEAFIPHHDDPRVLNFLTLYGTIKNSGYYSVFDLDMDKLLRTSVKEKKAIRDLLESKARYVPEIVKYELQ